MMAGSVVTVLPVLAVVPRAAAPLPAGPAARERQGLSAHVRFAAFLALACTVLRAERFIRAIGTANARRFRRSLRAWTAAASDQVSASLRKTDGANGAALCLDFDFHGVSGYAAMRRPLHIDYPDNYEFDVRVRGSGPDNAFQFKLADAKNENVWWVNRADFAFPREWTEQRFKKRQIGFAWGPIADRTLRSSESIEFTIYAVNGGRGEVCFDQLVFRERPPPPAVLPKPLAQASSSLAGAPASNAIDGDLATAWRSDPARGAEQSLIIDLGIEREFGGLVLHWHDDAFASQYDIALSDDARDWRSVRRVTAGNGGVDPLVSPGIRSALHSRGAARQASRAMRSTKSKSRTLRSARRRTRSSLSSRNRRRAAGIRAASTTSRRTGRSSASTAGMKPASFPKTARSKSRAADSRSRRSSSTRDGHLTTWADATISHSLADGYLPIPSVAWQTAQLRLTITAFAAGRRGASELLAQYVLENTTDAAARRHARTRRAAVSGQSGRAVPQHARRCQPDPRSCDRWRERFRSTASHACSRSRRRILRSARHSILVLRSSISRQPLVSPARPTKSSRRAPYTTKRDSHPARCSTGYRSRRMLA